MYVKNKDTVYMTYLRFGGGNTRRGIILTKDGGINWEYYASSFGSFSDMSFFTDQIGLLCYVGIYKTQDTGETWSTVYDGSSTREQMLKIVPVSDKTAFAYGGDVHIGFGGGYIAFGKLLKTENAGSSWNELIPSPSGEYITSMSFINEDKGYLTTLRGNIYKTIDKGEHWNLLRNEEINFGIMSEKKQYLTNGKTIYESENDFENINTIKRMPSGFKYVIIGAEKFSNDSIIFITKNSIIKIEK
jgi:photosystem II stability/assembly factor-like uncharacterized protein